MKILKESKTDLYKGVFWVIDPSDYDKYKDYYYLIPCDNDGNVLDSTFSPTAKSGLTHNHERLWNMYNTKLTRKYPYNYFPRGRVEIKNGKATIWVNPMLNTEEFKKFITSEYNLIELNGIKQVDIKSDFSSHYKCHFDEG